VPDYVVCKMLEDSATSTIYVEAHKLNPGYRVRQGSEAFSDNDGSGPAPLIEIYRDNFSIGNVELPLLLRRIFEPFGAGVHTVGGIDVGKLPDPTEIVLSKIRGRQRHWSTRLQLKGMSYDKQAEAIRAMDEIFRPDHGWGLDATGSGNVLEDFVRAGDGGYTISTRLTGFVLNSKGVARNPETGEESIDPATKLPRRVSYKELGTQLLERGFMRGLIVAPWDPDLIREFTSHTATKLRSGERQFTNTNDHLVDAKRVEELRLFEMEYGSLLEVPIHFTIPPDSARDSNQLMREY
jgi:hypothetical protein